MADKKLFTIVLFFCPILLFGQWNIGTGNLISPTNKNFRILESLQIDDTLRSQGKIIFPALGGGGTLMLTVGNTGIVGTTAIPDTSEWTYSSGYLIPKIPTKFAIFPYNDIQIVATGSGTFHIQDSGTNPNFSVDMRDATLEIDSDGIHSSYVNPDNGFIYKHEVLDAGLVAVGDFVYYPDGITAVLRQTITKETGWAVKDNTNAFLLVDTSGNVKLPNLDGGTGDMMLILHTTGIVDTAEIAFGTGFNIDGNENMYAGTGAFSSDGSAAVQNFAAGISALDTINAGELNTAVGYESGLALRDGVGNTNIGAQSGKLMVNGSSNSSVGYNSAAKIVNGSNNTFIGASTQSHANATDVSSSIGLGLNAWCTANNQFRVGADDGQNEIFYWLPQSDSATSLGNDTTRFKELWVTGASVHVGDAHFTDTGYGNGKVLSVSGGVGTWVASTSLPVANTVSSSGLTEYATIAAAISGGKTSGQAFILDLSGVVGVGAKVIAFVP